MNRTPLKAMHQIGDFDSQCVSDDLKRLNCHVALAALNLPNVRAIQSRSVGENVLRPTVLEPQRPHCLPDLLLNILHQ